VKRETARVVNQFFDQIAIETYAKDRVNDIHFLMESCDEGSLKRYQGAIEELKSLLRAKEYAEAVLKSESNTNRKNNG